MLLPSLRVDEYIVKKKKAKTNLCKYGSKIEFIAPWKVEGALQIKSIWHYQVFIMTMMSSKSRLMDVFFGDSNLVVTGSKVQLCKIS